MARSVIPLIQGLDYQSAWFWLQACRLFQTHNKVIQVGYELEGIKSFDDVAVFYDPPIQDGIGGFLFAQFYQVKFHVDYSGAVTCNNLIDPLFIGAEKVSLLQKLQAAQQKFAPDGNGVCFTLLSPWPIHPDDRLAKLVSGQNGAIRMNILASKDMADVRELWKNHLGLGKDEDLYKALRPFRIDVAENLDRLRERLNDNLCFAGLVPVHADKLVNPYDDLIRKLLSTGQRVFTQEDVRQICDREGLWDHRNSSQTEIIGHLGVRSIMRWAEYMEDKTDEMLCLARHFDGRRIQTPELWQCVIYPELVDFLQKAVHRGGKYNLYLDVHASIAFAAGYALTKTGADIAPIQVSRSGEQAWRPEMDPTPSDNAETSWQILIQDEINQGQDVVVAISVTHEITPDVRAYVIRALPGVSRIISCSVSPNPGPTAIKNGSHAWNLAQALTAELRRQRTYEERRGKLHIFIAAPNGFVFFLGQFGQSLGQCVFYEYAFGEGVPDQYHPSLTLPAPLPQRP